jgi:acetoacetyl-CoA synthetase
VRNTSALRNPAALAAIAEAARRAGAAAPAPSSAAPGASGAPGAPEDTAVTVGRVFAEVLGAPVGETTDFFDAGGTSRQTMTLLRRLRLALDRPLLMEDFLADPTVRGVAVAMASGSGGRPGLEVLRRGRDDVPPLCVVHGYQGDVDIYRALVDALDTAGPVYGLTTDPFAVERPGASVTAIAAEHVQTVMAEFPRGPVSLVGFSFGGLVAFEVARQLTERGRSVGLLGLLDTEPPAASVSPLSRRLRRLAYYASLVVPGVGDEDLPAAVRRRLRRADGGGREHPGTPGTLDELGGADRDLLPTAERVHNAHRWAGYAGPVTYFRARRRIPLIMNQLYEWRRVAPRLTVVPVPGAHRDLLAAEHADVLAARVSEALGRAPRRTS